jgi:transposase
MEWSVVGVSVRSGSSDRVKTDRRDAIRLVRLLAAGELSFAFVPTVDDEAFRDLVRCIEDLRGDLMRARHRLLKFLLRRGHRYQDGHAWTPKHARWLRSLSFEGVAQATFADYCASVDLLAGRRATLVQTLEQTVPGCSHAPTISRLRCFRGIETLTAAGLCAETGGFGRSPGRRCCRGSSGSFRLSGPLISSAGKGRSPRPAPLMPAGCSSRPPSTTASPPRSRPDVAGASTSTQEGPAPSREAREIYYGQPAPAGRARS